MLPEPAAGPDLRVSPASGSQEPARGAGVVRAPCRPADRPPRTAPPPCLQLCLCDLRLWHPVQPDAARHHGAPRTQAALRARRLRRGGGSSASRRPLPASRTPTRPTWLPPPLPRSCTRKGRTLARSLCWCGRPSTRPYLPGCGTSLWWCSSQASTHARTHVFVCAPLRRCGWKARPSLCGRASLRQGAASGPAGALNQGAAACRPLPGAVRGGQVDDERSAAFPEGYPYKTERTAVIALAYIIMIFFYAQAFLGIADRCAFLRFQKSPGRGDRKSVV